MSAYRASFPSSYSSVAVARHALVHFARWAGLSGDGLEDFETAIGEALANAAEHGYRQGSEFSVRAEVRDDELSVEIADGGPGFNGWNALETVKPRSQSPRGFGIFIMRKLMDRVEYAERGTRVSLTKKLPKQLARQREA